MSEIIERIRAILQEDSQDVFPRYPQIATHLLADAQVVEKLESRVERGDNLSNIVSLGYSFRTGLQSICFTFSSSTGMLGPTSSILVLVNADCLVVGIVDPFVRERPNPKLPPLPVTNEQPFALSRPIGSDIAFTERDLYPLEVRSREFFEQLQIANLTAAGTKCTYETSRGRRCLTFTNMPYGPGGCDEWEDQVTTDESTDDCG